MPGHRISSLWMILLVTLLLMSTGPQAQEGARLIDYLPANTITYLEIPSLSRANKALEQHPIAVLLEDKEMQTFLKPSLDMAKGYASGFLKSRLGVTLQEVVSILSGRLEMALVHLPTQARNQPVLALQVEVGAGEEKAREVVKGLVDLAKKDGMKVDEIQLGDSKAYQFGESWFFSFFARGSLFVSTDRSLAIRILAGDTEKEGGLKASKSFQKVLARVNGAQGHFFFHQNVSSLFEQLAGSLGGMGMEVELYQSLLNKSGLGKFSYGGSITFGPLGARDIMYMNTPGERKGLLALFDTAKPGLTMPARLDADTVFYYGVKVDLLKVYDVLVDLIGDVMEEVSPSEVGRMEEYIHQVESGEMGFRLRDEVLASLGDEVALSMGLPSTGIVPDALLTMKLKNADKIKALLDRSRKLLPKDRVTVSRLMVGEVPLYVFHIKGAQVSPAVAVLEDTLVVGVLHPSVKKFLRGYKKSLSESDAYRKALASINLQDASSESALAFLDLRTTLAYLYDNFGPLLSSYAPDELPLGMDLALLPSTEALVKPFSPFISVSRFVEGGIISDSVGPLPMSVFQLVSMFPYLVMARPDDRITAELDEMEEEELIEEEEEPIEEEEPEAVEATNKGTLGIEVEDLDQGSGCRVTGVNPDGAGRTAGILVGDIIISVDGKSVADVDAVVDLVKKKSAGDLIVLKIKRGKEEVLVSAVLKSKKKK